MLVTQVLLWVLSHSGSNNRWAITKDNGRNNIRRIPVNLCIYSLGRGFTVYLKKNWIVACWKRPQQTLIDLNEYTVWSESLPCAADKAFFLNRTVLIFCFYLSMKTCCGYSLEAFLMSTHNVFLWRKKNIDLDTPLWSKDIVERIGKQQWLWSHCIQLNMSLQYLCLCIGTGWKSILSKLWEIWHCNSLLYLYQILKNYIWLYIYKVPTERLTIYTLIKWLLYEQFGLGLFAEASVVSAQVATEPLKQVRKENRNNFDWVVNFWFFRLIKRKRSKILYHTEILC